MQSPAAGNSQLGIEHLQLIESRIANERKSVGVAYLLWFFLGALSIHNFYLGKFKLALFQLFGGIVAITMIVSQREPGGIGMLGILLLVIWALSFLADLFLIPGRVAAHTERLRQNYMSEMRAAS